MKWQENTLDIRQILLQDGITQIKGQNILKRYLTDMYGSKEGKMIQVTAKDLMKEQKSRECKLKLRQQENMIEVQDSAREAFKRPPYYLNKGITVDDTQF